MKKLVFRLFGAKSPSEGWRGLKICRHPQQIHVHLNGHYAGTKDDLAAAVTSAIRDAVRRGAVPKNVLTSL
jgi:citrate lyase beta subunit